MTWISKDTMWQLLHTPAATPLEIKELAQFTFHPQCPLCTALRCWLCPLYTYESCTKKPSTFLVSLLFYIFHVKEATCDSPHFYVLTFQCCIWDDWLGVLFQKRADSHGKCLLRFFSKTHTHLIYLWWWSSHYYCICICSIITRLTRL